MLDRQKIETILTRRFPGATPQQVAAAANGIMGLGDEWEEIPADGDIRLGSGDPDAGAEFRYFRRRDGAGA